MVFCNGGRFSSHYVGVLRRVGLVFAAINVRIGGFNRGAKRWNVEVGETIVLRKWGQKIEVGKKEGTTY